MPEPLLAPLLLYQVSGPNAFALGYRKRDRLPGGVEEAFGGRGAAVHGVAVMI
jgi:hypothetical protein